jgi:hypothetical protein
MMSNNEDTVLAVVGPHRAPIIVRLNEFNGRKSVDFRRYFHPSGKEDLLPTQKGVSFDREAFALVQAALGENRERIADWLASGSGTTLSTHASAAERLRSELRPHTSDTEQWKSPTFFHVAAEGGVDRLTLNSGHPLNTLIEALIGEVDSETAGVIRTLVAGILISYYRSKMLFDGVAEMVPKEMFETFEMNWGIILKSYAQQLNDRLGKR